MESSCCTAPCRSRTLPEHLCITTTFPYYLLSKAFDKRKERCTPLTKQAVVALKTWLPELAKSTDWLFPTAQGGRLSADAVQRLLAKYQRMAGHACPSLKKKRVTPHVLRHTLAMTLLQAGIDRSVIALWLGHESVETTQIYLDADLALKEKILAKTASGDQRPRRFKPADRLLAFLKGL